MLNHFISDTFSGDCVQCIHSSVIHLYWVVAAAAAAIRTAAATVIATRKKREIFIAFNSFSSVHITRLMSSFVLAGAFFAAVVVYLFTALVYCCYYYYCWAHYYRWKNVCTQSDIFGLFSESNWCCYCCHRNQSYRSCNMSRLRTLYLDESYVRREPVCIFKLISNNSG